MKDWKAYLAVLISIASVYISIVNTKMGIEKETYLIVKDFIFLDEYRVEEWMYHNDKELFEAYSNKNGRIFHEMLLEKNEASKKVIKLLNYLTVISQLTLNGHLDDGIIESFCNIFLNKHRKWNFYIEYRQQLNPLTFIEFEELVLELEEKKCN